MEAGAGRARGWCLHPTYGGLRGRRLGGAQRHQATAGAGTGGSSATSERRVVTAGACAVVQHAPPFRVQLPTVTWPDSASGEANQASLCTGAAPPPHASPPQLLRSTQTTDLLEASASTRARARGARVAGVRRGRIEANLGTFFLPLERQYASGEAYGIESTGRHACFRNLRLKTCSLSGHRLTLGYEACKRAGRRG